MYCTLTRTFIVFKYAFHKLLISHVPVLLTYGSIYLLKKESYPIFSRVVFFFSLIFFIRVSESYWSHVDKIQFRIQFFFLIP